MGTFYWCYNLLSGDILEAHVDLFSSRFYFTIHFNFRDMLPRFILMIMRRCPADGIVINMVVGGEVVALKGLEESSGLVIAEMPINVSFNVIFVLSIISAVWLTCSNHGADLWNLMKILSSSASKDSYVEFTRTGYRLAAAWKTPPV